MRSAIFETERRAPSSNRNVLKSKQASASPRIPASSRVQKRSELDKGRGRSSSPYIGSPQRLINWNLDEMLSAYQESKVLPPMLSPNLPDLSMDKSKLDDIDDTPLIHLTSPGKPRSSKVDVINITPLTAPISKPKSSTLSSSTVSSANNTTSIKKKSRIRWVNKLDDPKPRFLLRFLYNILKYKDRPKRSPLREEFSGLGISLDRKRRMSTPVDKETETSKPATPRNNTNTSRPSTPIKKLSDLSSIPSTPKGLKEEVETKQSKDEDFIRQKTYWIKVAKETKFISDKTDGVLSVIMRFDSLILFTISYEFDDKLKVKMNIPVLDRYWKQLLEEISHTIIKSKEELAKSKNDGIRIYLRCLVGLLYKFNCIVLKKMNTIYETLATQESDLNKKVVLYEKILINLKDIDENSKQCEVNCPSIDFFIKNNFQEVWNKRVKAFKNVSSKFIPLDNNYYLPISNYTQLQEFVKFLFTILNEFITIYNNIYKDDLIYSLKSGLSGPN